MEKKFRLFWKGKEIGKFTEESMDMGYLEGKVDLDESECSKRFYGIVSCFDFKEIMIDPKKGIMATLRDETDFLMNVLVLGLSDEKCLSLKMIIGKQETIDWYLANVPEEK